MEKLNLRLQRSSDIGIFHDSRKDVRLIMQCLNKIVDKLNDVIEENNSLKQKIKDLKNEE